MINIEEIIGSVIQLNAEEYYAFDIKRIGLDYYCLGFRISPQFADEKMQIINLYLKDGKLKGLKYKGKDYQSLLNDFMEQENYVKRLQGLMNKYNQ